ncbi:hypothetical protein [Leptospira harrisiae]|uniref:hypothetical protein n=1 Tax=Leptospira harrisiae TaxID=2023189 RepID=UPI000C2B413A|nr:hypothetical protein [Leptospira harrisiae]PKA06468.1 hypothetical protein CH366_19055 [Leptospira harrisiae]
MKTKYIVIPILLTSLTQCLTWDAIQGLKGKNAEIETIPSRLLDITESENKIIVKVEAVEKSTDRGDRYFDPIISLCFILPVPDSDYKLKIKADDAIPCPDNFKSTSLTAQNKPHGLFFIGKKYVLKSPGNYDIFCECDDFPDGKEFKEILVGTGLFDKHYIILFQDGSAYALNSGIDLYPEGVFSSQHLESYLNTEGCLYINLRRPDLCEKETIFQAKPDFGTVGNNYSKAVISYPDSDTAYITIMFSNYGFLKYADLKKIEASHFSFKKSNSNLSHSISYIQIIPSVGKPYKSRAKLEKIPLIPVLAAVEIISLPLTVPFFLLFYSMARK